MRYETGEATTAALVQHFILDVAAPFPGTPAPLRPAPVRPAPARPATPDREPTRRPLRAMLECGLPLFPVDPRTKAPRQKYTDSKGITTVEELCEAWQAGARCFATLPGRAGLLVVDIDRKNGRDGMQSLQTALLDRGAVLSPALLEQVFTTTPGIGKHVYFKYRGPAPLNKEILRGVEIKYTSLCTAGGSCDHRGAYTLYGDPADAPELPQALRDLLQYPPAAAGAPRPRYSFDDPAAPLDRIARTLDKQGHYAIEGNRNRFCFELARYANKEGHSAGEVEAFLAGLLPDFDRREIQAATKSAYRGKRK